MRQHVLLALYSFLAFLSSCSQSGDDIPQGKASSSIQLEKVRTFAEEVTVRISGRSSGSGVIVGKRGNSEYLVLTAKHVVGIPPGPIEAPYQVITNKDEYELDSIEKHQTLDLALLVFRSDENYELAEISNRLPRRTESVILSGWRSCIGKSVYESNEGVVNRILPQDEAPSLDALDEVDTINFSLEGDYGQGYIVKYTNRAVRGMSGGPLFNSEANVIAIHGKPEEDKENQYSYEDCPALNESYGGNWGIPLYQISIDNFPNSGIRLSGVINGSEAIDEQNTGLYFRKPEEHE